MTYKEYVKLQLARASEQNPHFDKNGSSVTAICNRSFINHLVKCLPTTASEYIELIKRVPLIFLGFLGLFWLIIFPISFPITLLMRAYFSRRRAKKEMMASFKKEYDK